MSKTRSETTVKDDLINKLNEYIHNINVTLKNTGIGNQQEVFSALLNDNFHHNEFEPFAQDLINIMTLLESDPITVMSFAKSRRFTAIDVKDFQKEGKALISDLAKPLPKDQLEQKTSDCNNVSTLISLRESPQKILGHFTGNFVQQSVNNNNHGI